MVIEDPPVPAFNMTQFVIFIDDEVVFRNSIHSSFALLQLISFITTSPALIPGVGVIPGVDVGPAVGVVVGIGVGNWAAAAKVFDVDEAVSLKKVKINLAVIIPSAAKIINRNNSFLDIFNYFSLQTLAKQSQTNVIPAKAGIYLIDPRSGRG